MINLLIFIFFCCEWDRTNYPQVDPKLFYSSNFLNNMLISVVNVLIQTTKESNIYKFPIKNNKIFNDLLDKIDEIRSEYLNYEDYYIPISYKVFDNTILRESKSSEEYGYYFLKYSKNIKNTHLKFPILSRILQKHQNSISSMFFSKIEGPLEIVTHRGPYRGLLRGHITIINDNSSLSELLILNESSLNWEKNSGFLFDDTFFHCLNKKDNGKRVSLIFDIKRKFTNENLNKINDWLLNILNNSEYVNSNINYLQQS